MGAVDTGTERGLPMEERKPDKKPIIWYWIIAIVIFLLLNMFVFPRVMQHNVKEVGYDTFISMMENKEIGSVEIESSQITFTNKDETEYYKTGVLDDPDLVNRLYESGAKFQSEIVSTVSPITYFLVSYILPILLIFLVFRLFTKKMGDRAGGNSMMFGMGKSNAKIYVKSTTGIKFKDVAGEEEAKELLTEIVDFLHKPERYQEIGASMPKGALLVGPPGTGKTLLAKAVAGEADVPFFSISGSEFVEMFVGMGAAKVRDLFKQAAEKAPCIVFIDEFESNQACIILAATNRPESLDPALLRPGRFDRRIPVELPDLQGRVEILKVHAKKIKIAPNVDFQAIARTAAGASGAELANIVNEAALRAVRMGRKSATQEDMMESVEVVIAGYQKKSRVLSNKEKLIVSYHEVGHALVAALQSQSAPVQKITIIPRTSGALGYTMQVEEGERFLMSRTELEHKIATLTGGRVAEDLVFHEITTGASNDIEQATKLARAMISQYGMCDAFGMITLETNGSQYLGGNTNLMCSPDTQRQIDQTAVRIIQEQYERAKAMLQQHMPKLHEIAKFLYDHETITGEEFMNILTQPTEELPNQEAEGTV